LTPSKHEEAEKIIQDIHEKEVIEPPSSPWMSPVVLAKNMDGSTRFYVDYRQLNSKTVRDSYPE
jgi:hypothetical protein